MAHIDNHTCKILDVSALRNPVCSPSAFSTTPPSYPGLATDPVPRCENLKSSKTKELGGEGLAKHKLL